MEQNKTPKNTIELEQNSKIIEKAPSNDIWNIIEQPVLSDDDKEKLLKWITFANSIHWTVASILWIELWPKDPADLIEGINYWRTAANDNDYKKAA